MSDKPGITVREVPRERVERDIDCSTGLSCQGTVHQISTGSSSVSFYLDIGEEMPLKYKQMLVDNEEVNLKMVPKEDRTRFRMRIQALRQDLASKK